MMYLIITLFALGAIAGIIIATAIFSKKTETPKPAVYTHGLLVATALGLFIYYAVNNPDNYPKASLILFIVAALGGFILFANDMRKKPGPVALVAVHAIVAVVAFVLLLVFALF